MEESGHEEGAALAGADLADARRELDVAERRATRHLLWAVLGLSPAAVIPFVGLVAKGSFGLVLLLLVLVFLVEGWSYLKAAQEAGRLRTVVEGLEDAHRDALAAPDRGTGPSQEEQP